MAGENNPDLPPTTRNRGLGGGRVSVCFDPADDVAVVRAVHTRCAAGGQVAVRLGPDAAVADTVALSLALELGVLWRVPRRLRSGRAVFSADDREELEWEISWALHRDGIDVVWVLDAGRVAMLGWRWLRHLAVRERVHVVLLVVGDPPDRWQAAALRGNAGPRLLPPERLHPGPGGCSWWERPAHRRAGASVPVSHKRPSTTDPDSLGVGNAFPQVEVPRNPLPKTTSRNLILSVGSDSLRGHG